MVMPYIGIMHDGFRGDIFEQRESKVQVPGIPSPLQPGGLWWDALSNFVFKVDPFTGQNLEDLGIDEDDYGEIAKHFGKRIPPNIHLIDGTFANTNGEKQKLLKEVKKVQSTLKKLHLG